MQFKEAFTKYDPNRVMRLVCIGWFMTKLISHKLWLAGRLFPLAPVSEALDSLPPFTHTILYAISLIAIFWLAMFPNKKIAVVLLVAELLSCLLDQNRWQPWEYQFIFMTAVYIIYDDADQRRRGWQLILAGLLFFAGVGKVNSAFIHDIWRNLILHRWLGITSASVWISRAGYALPLIEMAAGACLLSGKLRKPAVWVLIGMHLFILLMVGPAGLNVNRGVWVWNILMPLLLLLLFYDRRFFYPGYRVFLSRFFAWIIILCWWILPWFQLAGYWDRYLSAVLYAGGVEQLFICTDNAEAKKEMAAHFEKGFWTIPCSPVIPVYKWSVDEMHVGQNPEPRINEAIIHAWRKKYSDSGARFYLYKPGFAPTVREIGR
jgi:hypothetical protein